ncbi:MAG: PHP domain-containing protein, partial [Proteobacteria bacterium]|nr:PHP domain-containing protein [Pseudomonadota bacterium]
MGSTKAFVHLHLHTEYSLVDSTVRIAELMPRCVAGAMPAIALTDQNNLFGMVKFFKKAVAVGVKPIIGADLRIATDDEQDKPYSLILLCQNTMGYRNLSRLLTRTYLEGQRRGEPLARREWLNRDSCEGLIALSGGMHGDVGRAL